jgi:hypothetical protein
MIFFVVMVVVAVSGGRTGVILPLEKVVSSAGRSVRV